MKKSVDKMVHDEETGMSAAFVAHKMVTQIMSKRMKLILIPGVQYQLICWLFNVLPVRLRLWIIGQIY